MTQLNRAKRPILALAGLLAAGAMALPMTAAVAEDGQFKVSATVGAEFSYIDQRSNIPGLDNRRLYPAMFAEIDIGYSWDAKRHSLNFVPYAHIDLVDRHRTYFDAREANYQYRDTSWSLLLGAHRVFWGVVESRRLVNVINQIDGLNDYLYGEDYLGQPMAQLALFGDWGRLEFYAMTGFRDRRLPTLDFTLPSAISYDRDGKFESSHGHWAVDLAVRYQNKFGPVDLGVSYFHGTNREPQLGVTIKPIHVFAQPFYERMDQIGVDVAWAIGDMVLKGEGIYRFNQGDSFFAAVLGGEYTFRKPFGTSLDLGVIAEYNLDKRNENLSLEKVTGTTATLKYSPKSIYDHDAFLGTRLTFNDSSDSVILAGALVDVKNGETYVIGEASTRLLDSWRIEAKARISVSSGKRDIGPLDLVEYSYSWAQLRVSRYF